MKPNKRKPRKFVGWRREKYLECIRAGMPYYRAAAAVGIERNTAWYAIKDEPDFARAVEDAEKQACEVIENALFQKAESGDVRAAIYWLENRNPERWHDRRQPAKVEVVQGSTDLAELERRLEALDMRDEQESNQEGISE